MCLRAKPRDAPPRTRMSAASDEGCEPIADANSGLERRHEWVTCRRSILAWQFRLG